LSFSSEESDASFEVIPLGSEDKPLELDSVWIQQMRSYSRDSFKDFNSHSSIQLVSYPKLLKEKDCESYQEPPMAILLLHYRYVFAFPAF
jgi:hypothetical protein